MLLAIEPFSIVAKVLGDVLRVRMEAVGLLLTKEAENGARTILYNGVVIAEGDIRSLLCTNTDLSSSIFIFTNQNGQAIANRNKIMQLTIELIRGDTNQGGKKEITMQIQF